MAEDVGRRAASVAEARELLGVPQSERRPEPWPDHASTAPASSWNGGEGRTSAPTTSCSAPSRCPAPRRSSSAATTTKSNPEALLVGALSSCHMLWFLALARKKGFEIASYEDDAEAILDGKRFTSATLRPRVRWAGEPPDPDAIEALHRRCPRALLHRQLGRLPGRGEPA